MEVWSSLQHAEQWQLPPAEFRLHSTEIHLWRLHLEVPEPDVARLATLLSADERERASRFHFARDRRHFIAARAGMRQILAGYAGEPPERLAFTYSPFGKPALVAEAAPLRFNLSHSGGYALLGVTTACEIGVDLERMRPLDDLLAIAGRFFARREFERLQALPAHQHSQAFFRCWTRKEAYIKAIGEGLSCPLDRFAVTFLPEEPVRIESIDGSRLAAAAWTLRAVDPAPGYFAAVAAPRQHLRLLQWQWNEPVCAGH